VKTTIYKYFKQIALYQPQNYLHFKHKNRSINMPEPKQPNKPRKEKTAPDR